MRVLVRGFPTVRLTPVFSYIDPVRLASTQSPITAVLFPATGRVQYGLDTALPYTTSPSFWNASAERITDEYVGSTATAPTTVAHWSRGYFRDSTASYAVRNRDHAAWTAARSAASRSDADGGLGDGDVVRLEDAAEPDGVGAGSEDSPSRCHAATPPPAISTAITAAIRAHRYLMEPTSYIRRRPSTPGVTFSDILGDIPDHVHAVSVPGPRPDPGVVARDGAA
jgi:hypothetical protein